MTQALEANARAITLCKVHVRTFALAVVLLLPALAAHADVLYVAPDGSDQNAGTEGAPFATLTRAQTSANPGDTVYLRGGTYAFRSDSAANGVLLDKSGQAGKPIRYLAYAGERPVLDFANMTAKARITGIRVTASWLELKGLELKGVPQRINTENESWGIYNTGSHNVYEALDIHHIMGPGLFIAQGSDNQVLQCDSHHNYDPMSKAGDGENADGFGCHASGGNNVFRGCRAWWNTDDGYDFISAKGTCLVERSWAFYNGYLPDTFTAKANGNGFKAGGYGTGTVPDAPPRHTVRFCLAFRNRAAGFYANHHPIGGDWLDNTGYRNARDFDMLLLEPGGVANHLLRNNLAYAGSSALANFSGGDDAFNSWNLGVTISDADFESVDMKGMDGPRKADGSLPDIHFMQLAAGSDLIDKGKDLGFPFVGAAPDLGAFELGQRSAAEPDADVDAGAGSDVPVAPSADASVASTPADASATSAPPGDPRRPDAALPAAAGTRADASTSAAVASDDATEDADSAERGHPGGCALTQRDAASARDAWVLLIMLGLLLRQRRL